MANCIVRELHLSKAVRNKTHQNWSGFCFPDQTQRAAEGYSGLTKRQQILVVVQHDIFVQILLSGAQPFPLLLGEVDGQIPKRHWHLKWKTTRLLTMGLCFRMPGETVDLSHTWGICGTGYINLSKTVRPDTAIVKGGVA